MVDFQDLCHRIESKVIPAWLSLCKVECEKDLPSPFYGEILFLRQWIKYLKNISTSQQTNCQASSMLLALIKLFSLKYSSASTEWLSILLEDSDLVMHWDERQGFEHMIQGFFGAMLHEQRDWIYFFKNEDMKFNGQVWLGRALAYYKELMRLVLLRAYMNVYPQSHKEIVNRNDPNTVDFFGPWRVYFQTSLLSCDENRNSYFAALEQMVTLGTSSQINLIKAIIRHQENLPELDVYQIWMGWGIVYLMMQQTPARFDSKIFLQPLQDLDPLTQWKLSYSAYIFCKSQIFKKGDLSAGLALVPLFGLSEGEVWWYWQDALNLVEKNMNYLIQHKLHLIDTPLPFWWHEEKMQLDYLHSVEDN